MYNSNSNSWLFRNCLTEINVKAILGIIDDFSLV